MPRAISSGRRSTAKRATFRPTTQARQQLDELEDLAHAQGSATAAQILETSARTIRELTRLAQLSGNAVSRSAERSAQQLEQLRGAVIWLPAALKILERVRDASDA